MPTQFTSTALVLYLAKLARHEDLTGDTTYADDSIALSVAAESIAEQHGIDINKLFLDATGKWW